MQNDLFVLESCNFSNEEPQIDSAQQVGHIAQSILLNSTTNKLNKNQREKMLYSHVTLLMLRVVDVVTKTTVQQSARMLAAEYSGDIQVSIMSLNYTWSQNTRKKKQCRFMVRLY